MYFEFVAFNFRRELLRDLDVRQGIAHAFDADEAVAALYLANAVRAVSPIHPHSWIHDSTATGPVYNPSLARVLLQYAAMETADTPLVILVNGDSTERTQMAYRLAASLTAAGLTVQVAAPTGAAYQAQLAAYDFCLFVGWAVLDAAPDFAFMFQENASGEYSLFAPNAYLQHYFTMMQTASTESAYLQAAAQLQHAFAEQLPVLGLAFRYTALLTSTRIAGNPAPAPGHVFITADQWRLE